MLGFLRVVVTSKNANIVQMSLDTELELDRIIESLLSKQKTSQRSEETAACSSLLPEDNPEVAAKLKTNKPCAGLVKQTNMHKAHTYQHTYINRAN